MVNRINLNTSKLLLYLFIGWGAALIGLFLATVVGSILMNAGASDWVWKLGQGLIFTIIILLIMFWMQQKLAINIWQFIRLSAFKKGVPLFMIGFLIPLLLVSLGVVIAHSMGLITMKGFNFSVNV